MSSMKRKEAKEAIHDQEYNIMKQLLQDKSITFLSFKHLLVESKQELTDFKLFILNDAYISHRALKQR